jgi:hypothetical protein
VTLVEMKVIIGAIPASAAAASWSGRWRPTTSPASSHTATTVTSSQARPTRRAASMRSKKSPATASKAPAASR